MIRTEHLPLAHSTERYIAHAILDNPKALNALNHPMAVELLEKVETWAADRACVAVFLSGEGERAFCAGGDVKYVTQRQPSESDADRVGRANDYFECEYRLDEALHRMNKPVIVWGNGIVMGGGMGLLQAASHRLVTDTSLLSMPETAIGFFPDVGAAWFLNRVSQGLGPLLGISGAHLSGHDALFLNLADLLVPSELFERVKGALVEAEWMDTAQANRGVASYVLNQVSTALPELEHSRAYQNIQTLLGLRDAPSVYHQAEGLKALAAHSDPWMQKLAANTAKGSPLSIKLTDAYLRKHRHSSLAECFAGDTRLANQLVQHAEFAEGVRAVLIDKDQAPSWAYDSIPDVPDSLIDDLLA